jgi:hypothetical protein
MNKSERFLFFVHKYSLIFKLYLSSIVKYREVCQVKSIKF